MAATVLRAGSTTQHAVEDPGPTEMHTAEPAEDPGPTEMHTAEPVEDPGPGPTEIHTAAPVEDPGPTGAVPPLSHSYMDKSRHVSLHAPLRPRYHRPGKCVCRTALQRKDSTAPESSESSS